MRYKFVIVFIFLKVNLFAQSKADRQLFQKFTTICNAYKQLPLQLLIEYKKSCNIPLHEDDSMATQGEFYLQKDGAYIHFGNNEQILTDSSVLVVMGSSNQMVLSQYKIDITSQINNMINMPLPDSSIRNLTKKYIIQEKLLDSGTGILTLDNIQNVYDTHLPIEEIKLSYNIKNHDITKIETLKRELIRKREEGIIQLNAKVISIPKKGDYLIKEDSSEFVYKMILHDANRKLPVTLADRIQKDASGIYMPVKAFGGYRLIAN